MSGGPDSLALLLLAQCVIPGSFVAVTVDHGLRPESAAEAASVGEICSERGIRHQTLRIDVESGSALQERARAMRYAALGAWATSTGHAAIVTAHHADDQAETLLMRLSRGAGVRGLAAMRSRASVPGQPDRALLRPLLRWRRSELAGIVAAAGIKPVVDPSNTDLRFERARVRASLGAIPSLDVTAVAASASHLAEADAAIEWAAERCFAQVETRNRALHWVPADTPSPVVLRVLERVVRQLGGKTPRGNALVRWRDSLVAGRIATLAGVRGDGSTAQWRFESAPPPRCSPQALQDGP